jgi:hypothetical protein
LLRDFDLFSFAGEGPPEASCNLNHCRSCPTPAMTSITWFLNSIKFSPIS